MRNRRHTLAIGLACSLASGGSALHAQAPPAKLAAFLQQRVGLDSPRMAAIERAEPVVKILETQNSRDIAVFGIIRVDVPREVYVARLQDFPSSLGAPTRPQFGIFHDPATLADVATATVAEQDVAQLKDCRPDTCTSKLPATDMQRIHDQIDWSSPTPNSRNQLNVYLRQRLVQYVTDYRARGDSALVVYDDRGGVHASDAFAALLAQSPYVYEDIPSLRQYLVSYPHTPARRRPRGHLLGRGFDRGHAPHPQREPSRAVCGPGDPRRNGDGGQAALRGPLLRGGLRSHGHRGPA